MAELAAETDLAEDAGASAGVAGVGFAGGGVEDCPCSPAQSRQARQRIAGAFRTGFLFLRYIMLVVLILRLVWFKHPPCHGYTPVSTLG